ncbi:hypothetical protein BN1708_018250, partial [Verticillium longisporum]
RTGKSLPVRHSAGLLKDDESTQESARAIPKSPTEAYSRRSRQLSARQESPDLSSTPSLGKQSKELKEGGLPHPDSVSNRLRRHLARNTQRERPAGFLATPDTSEIAGSSTENLTRPRSRHLTRSSRTPEATSVPSAHQMQEAPSPADSPAHTVFSSNVATPPITDADDEPFGDADESLQQSIRALSARPSFDTVAAQDASLPSPR